MARRRKIETLSRLPVETIWWHDAAHYRDEIDTEPLVFMETGVVVHENGITIFLAKTICAVEDWNGDGQEGDEIPRGMVIKRIRHGYVDVTQPEVEAYKERVNEEAPSGEVETDAQGTA